MGLLDPNLLASLTALKGLLGESPIGKYVRGKDGGVSAEGLKAGLLGLPVFDQKAAMGDMQYAADAIGPSAMLGIVKPTMFYRGTNPGATERIRTGAKDWDSYLFAASKPESAKVYGSSIETIKAKPDAKILMEGSREFRSLGKGINGRNSGLNMLEWADEMARRAKAAGYDAVHFKRQSDIGTPIINEDAFIRNYKGDE